MNNISSPRPDTDETIEAEIRRKGKTAPRITPEDIEHAIVSCYFFTAEDGVCGEEAVHQRPSLVYEKSLGLLTFCVLVLRNGFKVTGESFCVHPENFDAEIGKKIARENAKQKIWELEGYLLRQKIHDAS